jgi:hypothetical protein
MSKRSNKVKKLIEVLEVMIDARYKYLRELEYENHRYASKILEEIYNPAVEKFIETLEKKT